jgi:hypothetical protein
MIKGFFLNINNKKWIVFDITSSIFRRIIDDFLFDKYKLIV